MISVDNSGLFAADFRRNLSTIMSLENKVGTQNQ